MNDKNQAKIKLTQERREELLKLLKAPTEIYIEVSPSKESNLQFRELIEKGFKKSKTRKP
ncbi:hypothetical protein ACFSKN_04965 [Mariniflexile gromovii]|uniref:Uncharacterized protein n=1 Tax=Mariniflexile gromovii TaxID=362523 RepID=A0ABS4BNQ6_9FLAO|nr:hypothetical protein [Mariniflexile gromovii]MBP0902226.1 hypothetical protein [Mariniflexile gromovii]